MSHLVDYEIITDMFLFQGEDGAFVHNDFVNILLPIKTCKLLVFN